MLGRSRFLNGILLKSTVYLNQRDALKSVKFISQWYSKLTDIMDRINHCYALQVNFMIHFRMKFSIKL